MADRTLQDAPRWAFVAARPSPPPPPPPRRPWVALLWPYHLCVQLVCQGYRSSAVGENLFDKVRPVPCPVAVTASFYCGEPVLSEVGP